MRDIRLVPGSNTTNDIILRQGRDEFVNIRMYAGSNTTNDPILRRMAWDLLVVGGDRRAQISWAEFEVPNAPGGATGYQNLLLLGVG